jgi:hypothetical protein
MTSHLDVLKAMLTGVWDEEKAALRAAIELIEAEKTHMETKANFVRYCVARAEFWGET